MANFTYALGPWVRRQLDERQACWDAPDHADGRICLGSLPSCALSPLAEDHRPVGFFCFKPDYTPPLDYLVLGTGDCRDIQPSSEIRSDAGSVLGVTPEGNTIADWLGYWLFSAGDPTGESLWKLGTPTRYGEYEIHLAGHSRVWVDRFAGVADRRGNRLRDLLRADLDKHDKEGKAEAKSLKSLAKKLRNASKDKEADKADARAAKVETHAESVLDAMCRKHKCPPEQLSTEIRRGEAKTEISDDFSGDLSAWTQVSGSWVIVSGTLQKTDKHGSTDVIRHDTQLSATDYYAQAKIGTDNYWTHSIVCRYEDANNYYRASVTGSVNLAFIKRVGGSNSSIGLTHSCTWASLDTEKFDVNGSTLTGYEDATQRLQTTDSSLSSGLYSALILVYDNSSDLGTPRFDDFYATDGLVAMSLLHWMQSSKRDVGSRLSGMIGQRRHTLIGR